MTGGAKPEASALLNALPQPVLLLNPKGLVEAVSPKAATLLGAWITGRSYVSVLRQPELLGVIDQAFYDARAGEAAFLNTRDGVTTEYRAIVSPIDYAGYVMVSFENVSHVSELASLRRDFVANVSHELRSPITAILGFVDTIQGPAKGDAAATDRFLSLMKTEATRMNRLVSDLLSLSKLEAQARSKPEETVDLVHVIAQVRDALPVLSGYPSERFDLPRMARVEGDFDQLQQVAINLIENAFKYGGDPPVVEIALNETENDPAFRAPAWCLSVRDHGKGIAAWHIPRLTERFYRIDAHRSRAQGGTGLGLAIVKHIVKRHRGRLHITSEQGVGSCFRVFLPRM